MKQQSTLKQKPKVATMMGFSVRVNAPCYTPLIFDMENKHRDKAKEIADKLENDIANTDCGCTYAEIVRLAIITAKQVRSELPMYTGALNPKWEIYNFVVELLEKRLNGV